jgi:hypothetical protein
MKFTLLLISALSLAVNAVNKVKDPKFGKLGDAITNDDSEYVKDENWAVYNAANKGNAENNGPVTLESDDFKEPRPEGKKIDKFDLILKEGQTLYQDVSGLIEGRTYLMRIQVIADPDCKSCEVTFGAKKNDVLGNRRMDNEGGYFKIGQLHSATFVAPASTVKIFVINSYKGRELGSVDIREVLLHMISTADGDGDGDTFSPKAQSYAMRISSFMMFSRRQLVSSWG